MRIKRTFALFLSILVTFTVLLYFTMDWKVFPTNYRMSITEELQDNKMLHFEDRLKRLENDFHHHNAAVGKIKETLKLMVEDGEANSRMALIEASDPIDQVDSNMVVTEMVYDNKACPLLLDYVQNVDVQMLDVYDELKFDNPDGGVWKQGWKVTYDTHDWNKRHKLKVFVVPHSHNDPGWLKTVEQYYVAYTKKILDGMLEKLAEDPRRKFIWAEISFFSMWWQDLNDDSKDLLKLLVRNGQLEFVTGGWVMNDEANAHWSSILHQLTEGHQWLKRHLNYTPSSSWSIDPFGLSSTQAVLLKGAGLDNMLIQRVHYAVKKRLAKERQLEFHWRQIWDGKGETDILTHMMPFYSYDVPHTCGPDPKICCQFDFKRLPQYGLTCPWRVAPRPITEENVAERAATLLDQYRMKSQLFKTNVLLVPLGDDFRYAHPTEWDAQYENYQRLFDHMNGNLAMNVHAQFGTLSDYFRAVRAEMKSRQGTFPTLSGDFFTYADRDDHYWSGYYTSRPLYKRTDRVLLAYVRAAETTMTLATLKRRLSEAHRGVFETDLTEARRALSLFQHHDGITGTAKDHVVVDYAKKMLRAIKKTQHVIQASVHAMLETTNGGRKGDDVNRQDAKERFFDVDDVRRSYDALEERYTITIGPELATKRIVIYNSLAYARVEAVTFHVSTPHVRVLEEVDGDNKRVRCQISPIFEHGSAMATSKYQLTFVASVPAMGSVIYAVEAVKKDKVPTETTYADVKLFNQNTDVPTPTGFDHVEVSQSAAEFSLDNGRLTASFSSIGLLKAIRIDGDTVPVHLDFAKYGVRMASERSGAYLFLPDGDAVSLKPDNVIVNVIDGALYSSVDVQLPYVRHTVKLYKTDGADSLGLDVENVVDIERTKNFELAMRVSSTIDNRDTFYTDANGYQTLRRRRFDKLPLQANYYPVPTAVYIEDRARRLTLLTASPLGGASLKSGRVELMMDRRLNQDDNLGLGQGVTDNKPTRHRLRLVLERRADDDGGGCVKNTQSYSTHPSGFPTLAAHVSADTLLNPLVRLLQTDAAVADDPTASGYRSTTMTRPLGVDVAISGMRTDVWMDGKTYYGVTVHRANLNLCYADRLQLRRFPLSDGKINVRQLLNLNGDERAFVKKRRSRKIMETTLSYLKIKRSNGDGDDDVQLCPMDVRSFVIEKD